MTFPFREVRGLMARDLGLADDATDLDCHHEAHRMRGRTTNLHDVGRELVIVVVGRPVPTARVRVVAGSARTPRETVKYQALVACAARAVLEARPDWNPEGPVRLEVEFRTARRDCDGSNILKGIEDALVRAGVMKDDRLKYLRGVSWVLREDAREQTIIRVYALEGGCS